MSRAKCSIEPVEPFIKSAINVWKDLDPDLQNRALRLLSELCYAHVANQLRGSLSEIEAKDESSELPRVIPAV